MMRNTYAAAHLLGEPRPGLPITSAARTGRPSCKNLPMRPVLPHREHIHGNLDRKTELC